MGETPTPLLTVENLTVTYGRGAYKTVAVEDASFSVYPGETFGLAGESGSGKTTIGRAILRLTRPSAGVIAYNGKAITGKLGRAEDKALRRKIQMIFQDPMSSLNERAKVDYIVSEGLLNFEKPSGSELEEAISRALREVGLPRGFGSRYPHEFSGGQRQRIGIARAIIMNPEFIVADEPISALDVSIRAQVLNLLASLQAEHGLTYLFISHDLSVMRFFCDRIATMHRGRIVEMAPTEELFARPLHPYTKSLLSAVPYPDPDVEERRVYTPYDAAAREYTTDKPRMREISAGHFVFSNDEEAIGYQNELKGVKVR